MLAQAARAVGGKNQHLEVSMAENQAKSSRLRKGARIGGGRTRMDARDMDARFDYDERATVAWRSLDPFVQFYSDSSNGDVPDWQPRD
jgi:hypothetical protein